MLTIIYKETEHYNECMEWRTSQGWPILPKDILTDGLVVPGVAVMWAFYSQNTICQLGFLTVNPKADRLQKAKAVRLLIKEHKDLALRLGYKHIETVSSNISLLNSYKKEGFVEAEKDLTHLLFSEDVNFLE